MARPRVFVSSTYYDLKYVREALESFVETLGFEPVLFENGEIPFHSDKTIEESCYKEAGQADLFILIVGGRYGSLSRESMEETTSLVDAVRSITRKEYEVARSQDMPIFIFVEAGVMSEYSTYKKNRDNQHIQYAHVDDNRVYMLLDDILLQPKNNFIRAFSRADDITSWLKDQWAGIFAEGLRQRRQATRLRSMEEQISTLSSIVLNLKDYTENMMTLFDPERAKIIIEQTKPKMDDNILALFSQEVDVDLALAYAEADLKNDKDGQLAQRALSNLISSKNRREFFERIGVDKSEIKELEGLISVADFQKLKTKYAPREMIRNRND